MTDAITKAPGMDLGAELPQLFRLGKMLCAEAQDFLPDKVDTPGKVVALILMGQELGIPPMTALRAIYNFRGNCELYYPTMIGLLRRDGYGISWPEEKQSATKAVLVLTDPGGTKHVETFTIEDANRAGLRGDNWTKRPKTMLRARAVSAAMRGFVGMPGLYAKGEISEGGNGSPAPIEAESKVIDAPELGEEQSAVAEEQARQRNEQAALLKDWAKDWERFTTPFELERWCHMNGFAADQLVGNERGTLWRHLAANKSSHGRRLGVKPQDIKDWLTNAPEYPTLDNFEPTTNPGERYPGTPADVGTVPHDPETGEVRSDFKMPFGRHEGLSIDDPAMNRHYLRSQLMKLQAHGDEMLFCAVQAELERRDIDAKERYAEDVAKGEMGFLAGLPECRDEITLYAWAKEHSDQLGKLVGQGAEVARVGLSAQAEAVGANRGTVLGIAGLDT
jgi:hypothetical protein